MKLLYTINRVLENQEVEPGVFRLTVEGNLELKQGDVVFLRSWDRKPYLSRPVRVERCEDERISFVYETANDGVKLLSILEQSDEVELIGPFGNEASLGIISA
jgi:dihydroorotate dehydrogenase electron transfer subunit